MQYWIVNVVLWYQKTSKKGLSQKFSLKNVTQAGASGGMTVKYVPTNQQDADFDRAVALLPRFDAPPFVFRLRICASVSAILLRWHWSIVISLWQVFCRECCAVNDRQLLTHKSFTHLIEKHPECRPLGLNNCLSLGFIPRCCSAWPLILPN